MSPRSVIQQADRSGGIPYTSHDGGYRLPFGDAD